MKKYTLRRSNSKSRIDLILISEELSCDIINIKIIHCPFSDHDIKIMKLNVCDITRGSGTWIMNLIQLDLIIFDKCLQIGGYIGN